MAGTVCACLSANVTVLCLFVCLSLILIMRYKWSAGNQLNHQYMINATQVLLANQSTLWVQLGHTQSAPTSLHVPDTQVSLTNPIFFQKTKIINFRDRKFGKFRCKLYKEALLRITHDEYSFSKVFGAGEPLHYAEVAMGRWN